jgi:hypothetical protein
MSKTQPKVLKVAKIPSGFLFTILDNDGSTVLREFFDTNEMYGILECRYWLFEQYGWPNHENT